MKRSFSFVWALLVLCVGLLVLVSVLWFAGTDVGSREPVWNNAYSETENAALPTRLKIPKINVDAAVEHVGLTAYGAMDAPEGPDNVGWYDKGPSPGQNGSAVIDGHSGWKDGTPAVFDNLHKLQKGDKVHVEKENGATVTFIVREMRTFDPKADTSDVFGSSDGRAHLNLITCAGAWDTVTKSSSERIVVFADMEPASEN